MPYAPGQQSFTYIVDLILSDVDGYIKEQEDKGNSFTDNDVIKCIKKTVQERVSGASIKSVYDLYEEYWPYIEKHKGRNLIFKINNWLVDQVELIYSKRYA